MSNKKNNNLKRMLYLGENIALFEDLDLEIKNIDFADDVPKEFIAVWKEKQRINKEFNSILNDLKNK
jgi:hypothetical protein